MTDCCQPKGESGQILGPSQVALWLNAPGRFLPTRDHSSRVPWKEVNAIPAEVYTDRI